MMAEKGGGDTFLTDMLFQKKEGKTPAKPPRTKPNLSAKGTRRPDTATKDKESAVDSEEYEDMVYDMEYGKSLVQRADDFLTNKPLVEESKVSFINSNKTQAFD